MTIIYSVDYKDAGQVAGQDTNNVTKQSLSWDQVGTKLGLSRDQVENYHVTGLLRHSFTHPPQNGAVIRLGRYGVWAPQS